MKRDKGMTMILWKFWLEDRQDNFPDQFHVVAWSEDRARVLIRKVFPFKWWKIMKVEKLDLNEERVIL
jgi:hypothetical protein